MERVGYEVRDGVGWIDVDDGKVNVMSRGMQLDLHAAFDAALADDVVTVVRGRPGVFSAGFDLAVLQGGDPGEITDMVLGGFELAQRILAHPRPVVMACRGHAVAMGLFLLLSGDVRIGTADPTRYTANEVAIGLTLPRSAETILRHRLTPAAFQRAALLAVTFDPEQAVAAGILDEAVDPAAFDRRVGEMALALTGLDVAAQRATKLRVRSELLGALGAALALDRAEFDQLGRAAVGAGA